MTAYLVIDTSTRYGAAAVWRDGLSRSVSWRSRNNHTAELMPAVRWLTEAEGIAPDALDGVVVSVGPGGFSALRTGIGVAKGLAVAWSLPVAGVSTLEASAYPLSFDSGAHLRGPARGSRHGGLGRLRHERRLVERADRGAGLPHR